MPVGARVISSRRKEVSTVAKKPTPLKPGQHAPFTGIFTGGGTTVVVNQGETMPPTPRPGVKWTPKKKLP